MGLPCGHGLDQSRLRACEYRAAGMPSRRGLTTNPVAGFASGANSATRLGVLCLHLVEEFFQAAPLVLQGALTLFLTINHLFWRSGPEIRLAEKLPYTLQ